MLRRAVLISSILGAVSAAAALAFAPDLSRVGRIVSSLAPWKGQGFTPAPSGDAIHRTLPNVIGSLPDSLNGKFCRFPAAGSAGGHGGASTELAVSSDSSNLALLGQSRLMRPDTSAICTGTAPALPLP